MKWAVILIFILVSCRPANDKRRKFFVLKNFLEKNLDYQIFEQGEITHPPRSWLPLAEFVIHQNGHLGKLCLVYRVPHSKEVKGTLRLIQKELENSCRYGHEQEYLFEIDNIHKLVIKKTQENELEFNIDKKKIQIMLAQKLGANLYNKSKFSQSLRNGFYPGVIWLGVQGPAIRELSVKNLPERVSFRKVEGFDVCHLVDENCKSQTRNLCHQCPFGFYEVPHPNCPQGGTKICGLNECGGKNQPACIKQVKKEKDYCRLESPLGFCQQGLELRCHGHGILTCF